MIIKDATIVSASDTYKADIKIAEEQIAAIGKNIFPEPGEKIIDAAGKLAIPGGVDVHTHMDLDAGVARATDDFYTGTVAAACGGTTTIVDHMAFGPKGCSISHQLNIYHGLAAGSAVIDYSFHGVLDHVDDELLYEMEHLITKGITSHKFYLTYDGKISDIEAFRLHEKALELGVMLTVHPENDGVITYLREKLVREGKTQPIYHAKSRPIECENEAIQRMIYISSMAGDAPLYFVHVSNADGLDTIVQARQKGPRRLFAETCPQYLLLNENRYNDKDGLKYIISPPLRHKSHNQRLWNGITLNQINVVATDHCPFNFAKEKQLGADDFTRTPNGAPGVELRIPLMYSEGVSKGRISANKFVEVCCTNPSKLFGLYPRKGIIAVGSDADIVLIDPDKNVTVTHGLLHENVDYTPYEGIKLKGYPVLTLSRGKIIAANCRFIGKKGDGRFIYRKLPQFF